MAEQSSLASQAASLAEELNMLTTVPQQQHGQPNLVVPRGLEQHFSQYYHYDMYNNAVYNRDSAGARVHRKTLGGLPTLKNASREVEENSHGLVIPIPERYEKHCVEFMHWNLCDHHTPAMNSAGAIIFKISYGRRNNHQRHCHARRCFLLRVNLTENRYCYSDGCEGGGKRDEDDIDIIFNRRQLYKLRPVPADEPAPDRPAQQSNERQS